MEQYWETLSEDRDTLFLKIRDHYAGFLKYLYHTAGDVPDFNIYFSKGRIGEEEGRKNGYPVYVVHKKGKSVEEVTYASIAEIPNFENSYTWLNDHVFAVFDFSENGDSPLLFMTEAFFEELHWQIENYGISKVRMGHMYDLLATKGIVEFFYGFYRLDINFMQNLSAATYEKEFADSRLIIPRFDTQMKRRTKAGLKVGFQESIPFNADHLRQVRKLLELSDENLALVVNENGKIIGMTDQHALPSECEVRMHGHLSWTIHYSGSRKISFHNARYHLYAPKHKEWSLKDELGDELPLSMGELLRIETVMQETAHQKHGTILIIGSTEDIEAETERLGSKKHAIRINGINLESNKDLIHSFTSIDGAIFMDVRCTCMAIGAILDGDAVTSGSLARGSRYNSTINYIHRQAQLGRNFFGVVMSEDRTLDLVTAKETAPVHIRL